MIHNLNLASPMMRLFGESRPQLSCPIIQLWEFILLPEMFVSVIVKFFSFTLVFDETVVPKLHN